ncbi:hypothetical protein GCM10022237_13390 [Nocardioides ginsengisoli]|uniref:Uncharacterized protein n=1 Tax=Nocardioides ginsengisoli TaxID=363868 RepID=A0ABW3VZ79_9ACTN
MTPGWWTADARAQLLDLLAAAAPEPLPPDQAIGLLVRVDEDDVEALGRLAYRALTGAEPGAEPAAPAAVLPGFPPFASEVIARAIVGPDHLRPTPQALLVVLETIDAAAWPTAGRPHVTLPDTPAPEPVASAPVSEHDEEFRSLLIPSREVPRFEPLTAADPEPAPEPELEVEAEEPEEPEEPEVEPARPTHDEFREIVATPHPVPHFEPLDGAGTVPGLDGRQRRRRRRSGSTAIAATADRTQTLILVAVILVLVVIGVLYAASHHDDGATDTPQGASRSLAQSSPVRV